MSFAIWIVVITTIVSVIATIYFISKGDPNYRTAAKRNTMNLTIIYVVATILSLIALALYIWLV